MSGGVVNTDPIAPTAIYVPLETDARANDTTGALLISGGHLCVNIGGTQIALAHLA